ncbi:hypothetical protein BB559_000950 [Furculomyces boomerangus]|uniref:DNA-directed RNA polymerase subunit beta n=2 Tax=Harpellales TaxID=61421 RepID=A0A2T9Z3I3_9FUNG|nr:hypothetical protein BB559_000950 [Furculomyces boomerangus]PVZ97855.1 hypothetical protein BB558_006175 [Smittium angustum]
METKFGTLQRQHFATNPSDEFEYPELQKLGAPHIDSFNKIWESSGKNLPPLIDLAVADIGKVTVYDKKVDKSTGKYGNKLTYWFENVELFRPSHGGKDVTAGRNIYPSECRERASTYKGKLVARLHWSVNDGEVNVETKSLGFLPVMVKSNRCNIQGMGPREHIKHHEEAEEFGGYFIVNGGEKIIRMLIAPRRNHVTAIVRPSYSNRGPTFTSYATQIRCARKDQTSSSTTLHYLTSGNLMFRFSWYKQEYLIPVSLLLKALCETTDKEIFDSLIQTNIKDTYLKDQIELLLRTSKSYKVNTKAECLAFLGSKFRVVMGLPEDLTDEEVGKYLIEKVVMVHLGNWRDKFNMIIFMIRKLYALVTGECQPDNPDSMQHQELFLPGFLYLNVIKEKIQDIVSGIRGTTGFDLRSKPSSVKFTNALYVQKLFKKTPMDIGQKLQYFLATGNLASKTGMDLQQTTGFTMVAEKLNFLRYISHFQCVHRGSFFSTLKTTTIRKLLPESWGFMCPVHTPDGTPCGLLNHLAQKCEITTYTEDTRGVEKALLDLGVSYGLPSPHLVARSLIQDPETQKKDKNSLDESQFNEYVSVQIDGRIIGFCTVAQSKDIALKLRHLKILSASGESKYRIPFNLEIGYVPKMNGGQLPGLYIFSTPARFTRPVRHLASKKIDYIGSFEQVYMDIACLNEDIHPGITEYQEIEPTHILSSVANLTPFCDFNQSPRNMYQCQMGKQSMGTPAQALSRRADNKLYRLQNVQTPIVRPKLYDDFGIDGYPNGMNAVVAVLSYTGYDMEDAMIINKSGLERGFGYGSIYKTVAYNLAELRKKGEPITNHFMLGSDVSGNSIREKIDADGLPFVGTPLVEGDPVVAFFNETKNKTIIKAYKGEPCFVDTVRLVNTDTLAGGDPELQLVQITFRIPRSPVIGDKFSSRHGQKGVCSVKYPSIDLPFTESGMQPDVIINPHAFPSRMTIGMFVESLAGKSGALYGVAQDATPFQFDESHTAADYFGEQLKASGYNYHGNEPMYSGVTGKEMRADVYIGVVYYQRLRHMVKDKFQVRTTGPIDPLTRQPIKGRKRGGGIRLGEMERDSLLAHGTSFILQDRLINCSDYARVFVCRTCGSIISPVALPSTNLVNLDVEKNAQNLYTHKSNQNISEKYLRELSRQSIDRKTRLDVVCRICENPDITVVAIPFVLKYLATELASMNIKIGLTVS